MYSNFKEQEIEYVKQAVQEDNAGNNVKAFPLYMNARPALEYFKTHLKYEKNPKIKEAITLKFTEYLRRAEEIRVVLDEGGPGPTSNGDAVVVRRRRERMVTEAEGMIPRRRSSGPGLIQRSLGRSLTLSGMTWPASRAPSRPCRRRLFCR